MSLLRDIQDGAADGAVRLSDLLRKSKILAARLDNAELRLWLDKELNGYQADDELPSYRRVGPNRVVGDFTGPYGGGISNGEIPSASVDEADVSSLFHHRFVQGVAHYESLIAEDHAQGDGTFRVPWPGNALVRYAGRVYEDMTMMSARQQISRGTLVGLLDTVRNRLLDLALALERENPDVGEAPIGSEPVAPATVSQIVQNVVIQGGQNTVGTSRIEHQIANVTHDPDWDELKQQLLQLGIAGARADELRDALQADGSHGDPERVGPATRSWIARAAEIGTNVSSEVLTGLINRQLGGA